MNTVHASLGRFYLKKEQLVTNLFLIVSVIVFCFALLQVIDKDKSRVSRRLSLLFFSLGYIWLYYWMYRSGVLSHARRLIHSDVAVTFLLGPLVYFYIKSLDGKIPRYSFTYLIHYMPAALVFIFLLIYFPGKTTMNIGEGNNPDYSEDTIVFIINIAGDFSFFTYTILSAVLIRRINKTKVFKSAKALFGISRLLLISLFSYILLFFGHLLHTDTLTGAGVLINGFNCVLYFFINSRYPGYTGKIIRESKNEEKGALPLSGITLHRVMADLEHLVRSDKVYRDPDLSLQSLSILLGIKNYQLTFILNENLNTNFRAFINFHRVEEAKQLLIQVPVLSILDIAFAVGFNSKSPFNTTFHTLTGETPSEYRKNPR